MSKVSLVIIDDNVTAHSKLKEWVTRTSPDWCYLYECEGLISDDERKPEDQINAYNAAVKLVTTIEGPMIVVLDCCLLIGGEQVDLFRSNLFTTYAAVSNVNSEQVEGVVLGVNLVQINSADPLMIVLATELGASHKIKTVLTEMAQDRVNFTVMASDTVAGVDSLKNVTDMNEYMEALLKKWDDWQKSPFYDTSTGGDCNIKSLLQLYDDCWRNNDCSKWDGSCVAAGDALKQFAHDCFNVDTTKEDQHVPSTCAWLFGKGAKTPAFDGDSLKVLFIADRVAGRPSRYAGNNRPIKSSYLSAALKKLEIPATLQKDINEWWLPVIPGAAFLIALKTFLNSLVSDNNIGGKLRPPPISIEWKQYQLDNIFTLGIEIGLENFGAKEADKLLRGEGGSANILRHLLKAHTDGVSAMKPWSRLFRARDIDPNVATATYRDSKLCIEWSIRNGRNGNA
jgi:hypothetical protein